jgi:cobalt-zinc-cadmium efflux system outer membrane protein
MQMKASSFVGLVKIPRASRFFLVPRSVAVALFVASALAAPSTFAQSAHASVPLREADVIRLAKEAAPGALVAEAQEKTAALELRGAGLHPNPALVFARESVNSGPQAGRGSQDLVGLNVPIDVAGPRARRALRESQSAWRRVEASLSRTEAILHAVLAFYDVGLAQARVATLSSALENLEEAARVLERRQEVGTVSGYERARLNIEKELTRSQLKEAQGTVKAAQAYLAALLGKDARSFEVEVDLSSSAAERAGMSADAGENAQPSVRLLNESPDSKHESLRLAQESEQLARQAKDRASFTWFPELELGAGLKRANNAGSADGFGYFVGANLTLPLFDRGQGERAHAEAEQVVTAARSRALGRSLAAEIQSTAIEFESARDELERFLGATSAPVEELLRAAQGGYREGERTIVELVDAQRARTEVELRRLSLLTTVKRGEVRLRSAQGELK